MSKPNPTILFVGFLPPAGGGSPLLSGQLLRGLADTGYPVVALARGTARLQEQDSFAINNPDISVSRFTLPYLEPNPRNPSTRAHLDFQTECILSQLPPLIARHRPDVVLAGHENVLRALPDLARRHGLPCVVINHGVVSPAVGGTYRADIAEEILGEFRQATKVIAVAQHIADGLRSLQFDNVTAIPNAVDVTEFRPGVQDPLLRRQLSLSERDIVILHPSTLRAVKRPLDIVRSAAQALRQAPNIRYLIAVMGSGPLRADMEAAAAQAGILDSLRFIDQVEHRRMPDFYRLADAVVMPSESEGMALAYLEALASGCVLLASDIPAAREVVVQQETGFLFDVGDVAALAALSVRVATDPALRRRIGDDARAQSLARPGLVEMVAAYAASIEGAIAASAG